MKPEMIALNLVSLAVLAGMTAVSPPENRYIPVSIGVIRGSFLVKELTEGNEND